MATCFLLARLKRPPSLSLNPLSPLSPTTPTTPFTPSTSTVEISETARNILEDIIDPLVVVSYFGCSRSVQDSLCTAFEQIYKVENTSSLDGSGSNNLSGGIWGWLAPPSGNPDPVLGVTTQTLHLVYLDQELNREREEEGEEKEDFFDPFAKNPDAILAPLMAICSTQLNVISTTAQDTEADLARFTQSLEVFTSRHQARRKLNLAPMEWYWSEPVPDSTTLSPTDADPGVDILEGIIANQTDSSQERYSGHLTALDQCFGDFDCYPSVPLPTTMDAGRQGADQARRPSGSESAFLGEASITQVAQLHRLISYSNHKSSDEHSSIDCSRMANGSELYVKMQACLTQLNGYPTSFDVLGMREEARNLIRDRAFHHGELIYDRIINKYLDRLPIPQPWHTLSMMHHDAQTKAMEDIEKRYGRASGYHLSSIASDFRVHCLENGVSGANRGDSKLTISNWDMMVPTGGLFFDFYSANATALQNHHIESLQEHWQSFVKSRLPGAPHQSSESNVPSSLLPPLKDHAEFLLAVDQVRRSYLGACIPSPEAITVLESLEEWQQTESVEFLKSIANGSSSAPSSQPKRSGSISHQPTSFSSGVGANSDSNSNESSGGSAVLTDTLNNKRTSIQAITRANSKSKAMNSNNSNSDGGSNGGTNNNDNDAGDGEQTSQQHADQTPKELEQQITEILSTKLKPRRPLSQTMSGSKGQLYNNTSGNRSSLQPKEQVKGSENKIIHFGWTLHILHANTLQYAWIWSWLYSHEGSSRQNVGNKMYTASKWILLPPKDLIRTRKDWKITYGDRVSIVSYWFSSRNAKVELPEYLPRAQGGPCRHVVPYGETYIICKTCPADVLCMRCFRASDHTDHVMFLQCSWGTSVCACGDPLKARDNTGLHCSLHSAETHRSYSRSAKGHPCQMKFKAGDRVFHCKLSATDASVRTTTLDTMS
ncbi:hypothetical protein BGX31_001014 [Mortierella sp. GBA43]|nr:hypothetical protein BGX31_001014 [Mortierella sp. GBA43]